MFFNTHGKMNNFSFGCQRRITKDKASKTRSRLIVFAVSLMAINYALVAQYRDEGAKPAPILAKSEMTAKQIAGINLAKPDKRHDLH